MLTWTLWFAGCGESEPQGLSPSRGEVPPAASELEGLAGRWEAVTLQNGAAVHCEGEVSPPFVEFRGDGDGGWEMLAQMGEDLAILPVHSATRAADGFALMLAAITPGEPDQSLKITWVADQQVAMFSPLLGDRPYASPGHLAKVPTLACEKASP